MLNFGLSLGRNKTGVACLKPEGEIIDNRNFDCGTAFWDLDPNYGGTIVNNGDGTITLTATEQWSSITQLDKFPIPAGDYHMGVSVSAITGKGKMSYKLADDSWHNAFTYDTEGTHQVDITATQDIITIDIGADDDNTAVITFDGVSCMDADIAHMPTWWKIATLDSSDILGAWDFASQIHGSESDALTTLDGTMENFTTDSGSPTWNGVDEGMNFGGAGSIGSMLPDGLDMRELSCIIEFHKVTQNNSTLDALFSHYYDTTNGRYVLQNAWNINKLRWTCGNETSVTIEEGSLTREGVVATCGRELYLEGTLLGTVPDSGATSTSNQKFRLGCINVGNNTQYSKMKVKKLLLVKRVLTEAEVVEITNNINGTNIVTFNGETIFHNGEAVRWN